MSGVPVTQHLTENDSNLQTVSSGHTSNKHHTKHCLIMRLLRDFCIYACLLDIVMSAPQLVFSMASSQPLTLTTTQNTDITVAAVHAQYQNNSIITQMHPSEMDEDFNEGQFTSTIEPEETTLIEEETISRFLFDFDEEEKEKEENGNGNEKEGSRSRVLFDYELEEEDETDSDKVSFNDDKNQGVFSFQDPKDNLFLIKMTSSEINQIFNKERFLPNKKRTLTKSDRKKARECRRKNKLFFRGDKKCYHPLTPGPCKTAKWIVAHRVRKSEGVCRNIKCPTQQDGVQQVFFNGSCVPLNDPSNCPALQQLAVNRHGDGGCECIQDFSKSSNDSSCYRNFFPGPCNEGLTWNKGKCIENTCEQGKLKWSDEKCYGSNIDSEMEQCLQSEMGEIFVEVKNVLKLIRFKTYLFIPSLRLWCAR